MANTGIEDITQRFKRKSEYEEIEEFLSDIIYEELEKPGWWKDLYREKIIKYSRKWVDNNEV